MPQSGSFLAKLLSPIILSLNIVSKFYIDSEEIFFVFQPVTAEFFFFGIHISISIHHSEPCHPSGQKCGRKRKDSNLRSGCPAQDQKITVKGHAELQMNVCPPYLIPAHRELQTFAHSQALLYAVWAVARADPHPPGFFFV